MKAKLRGSLSLWCKKKGFGKVNNACISQAKKKGGRLKRQAESVSKTIK